MINQLKTYVLVIFCTIGFSIGLTAQTPFWFSGSARMDFINMKYLEGHDEHFFSHSAKHLNGNVETCTYEEFVSDKDLEKKDGSHFDSAPTYQLKYGFSKNGQIHVLNVNSTSKSYKAPSEVSFERLKKSTTWSGGRKIMSMYADPKSGDSRVILFDYDEKDRIITESWTSYNNDQLDANFYPFQVRYNYKEDGSYWIVGTLNTTNDKGEPWDIEKYRLYYSSKGNLVKRVINNRNLRESKPNVENEKEVFEYTYEENEQLNKMSYQKGRESIKETRYVYKDLDAQGNWTMMKVVGAKNTSDFVVSRKIKYFKETE